MNTLSNSLQDYISADYYYYLLIISRPVFNSIFHLKNYNWNGNMIKNCFERDKFIWLCIAFQSTVPPQLPESGHHKMLLIGLI